MMRAGCVLLIAAGVATTGCGGDSDPSDAATGQPTGTLRIAAASSLTDVMRDLATAFEQTEPAVTVETSVGGSSSLAVAIEEGAPADVFASANEAVMDRLGTNGAIVEPAVVFATNTLVLAVPAGERTVTTLDDVARGDVFVGACASQVPCGDYTDRFLQEVGIDASFDTRDADVRSVVNKVIEGELDAGFVYRTDVLAFEADVDVIALTDATAIEILYPAAVVVDAPNPAAAAAFVDFLVTDAARAVLERAGFGAP